MLDSTSRISSDNLKDHFDNMTCSVQSLQKFLSDSALFLPSYSIRTSQQVCITSLTGILIKVDVFFFRLENK